MFRAVDCMNGQLPVPPLPAAERFSRKFLRGVNRMTFSGVASI
jgi:hypothetical protein